MTHEQKQLAINYLPLLIAILGIAVSWGVYSQKISAQEIVNQQQATKIENLEKVLTDLRVDTASIKSDVSSMKKDIEFIKLRVQ